jgi:hypothetical protein
MGCARLELHHKACFRYRFLVYNGWRRGTDRYQPLEGKSIMNPIVTNLVERMKGLELELEAELAKQRAELRIGFEKGRIAFEEEILRRHREMRTRLLTYLRQARPMVVITAPVIYAMIVPFALLDAFVTIFQAICFPVYRIEKVRRRDYLVFDRRHLAYLNALEKFNCAYCSYANGVIAYSREIAGRTEAYWCPIKHARKAISTHAQYAGFVDYGDAEAYRAEVERLTQPPGR